MRGTPKRRKPHKYRAQRTTVDGISFPSKLEASVYVILKLRERQGEIKILQLQSPVVLREKCKHCGAGKKTLKVDFKVLDLLVGHTFWVEAKGVRTKEYIEKEKLWKKNGPGDLEVWGGSWQRPILLEVIKPCK